MDVAVMGNQTEENELESMPNIGKAVALRLREAGIATPDGLRQMGAAEAAARLASLRPEDPPCRSMLSGLEGAIRGVRWHEIPKAEREALWTAYCRGMEEGQVEPKEGSGD